MIEILTSGFVVADIIAADLPKIAEPGHIVYTPKGIKLTIGGHPCNVSIDLIQLGFKKGSVGLVGAIGKDAFGNFIKKTLEEKGVVTHFIELEEVGTTKNVALVVKGEDRRFHIDLGASWYLDPKIVSEKIAEFKPKLVYTASGICGRFDDELGEILKMAKSNNSLTFVDIVAPYGKDWSYIIDHLKYADVFHCNDIEIKNIFNSKDLNSAMKEAIKKVKGIVFVTLGERGAIVVLKDGTYIKQEGFKVEAIDPTGAGDAFSAGIIFSLMKKNVRKVEDLSAEDLKEVLMFAQASGAACVTGIGTTTSVTYENVNKLIESQGKSIMDSSKIYNL